MIFFRISKSIKILTTSYIVPAACIRKLLSQETTLENDYFQIFIDQTIFSSLFQKTFSQGRAQGGKGQCPLKPVKGGELWHFSNLKLISEEHKKLVCCFFMIVLCEGEIKQYFQGNWTVCVPLKYPRSQMLWIYPFPPRAPPP